MGTIRHFVAARSYGGCCRYCRVLLARNDIDDLKCI